MLIKTNIDFLIIKEIKSEGVNSNLYIVRDIHLDEEFILKRIEKSKIKNIEKYFEESKKMFKLNHPNIININSTSYDKDYIYISMPYYKKGSLLTLIKQRNLTLREIIKYSIEFLSAVDFIHNKNIIHCDIKPSNILINDDNTAILADFGTSLNLNSKNTANLRNVYYKHIAPEQSKTSLVDKKIDIYQIGTTLYRMCNGDYEYNRQLRRYKNLEEIKKACSVGKFPIRKKYLPHIPKSMIDIIEKCLNINPNDRYENVSEIIYDLSNIKSFGDVEYKRTKEIASWTFLDKNIDLFNENCEWKVLLNNKVLGNHENKGDAYKKIRKIIKENALL